MSGQGLKGVMIGKLAAVPSWLRSDGEGAGNEDLRGDGHDRRRKCEVLGGLGSKLVWGPRAVSGLAGHPRQLKSARRASASKVSR